MSKRQLRILHLEDRPLDADLIERELQRAKLDFASERVETEEQFLHALESSDPDVILADYNLPGFDGIAALRIARDLIPDTPFIIVSGAIGEERAAQALREGAADYIVKDRPARLAAAITRAVEERRERLLRKRAQEALRRSEERYKYAALATQELVLDWDLATDRVVYNEALRAVWGHETEEDISIDWVFEHIHPEDRESIVQSKREAIEHRARCHSSYRFRAADGTYGYVSEHAVVVRDRDGNPTRVICAMLDVTEQKVTAELMARSERRFRSVAETARDAIIITDADSEIVFVNEVGHRYFGHTIGQLLGRCSDIFIAPQSRAAWRERMQTILGGGSIPGGDQRTEAVRADGTQFPIDVSMSVWQAEGKTYVTSFVRDVSEQAAAERRQALELAINRVLLDPRKIEDGMHRVLREVGQTVGWKIGLSWSFDELGTALRCSGSWTAKDFDGSELLALSKGMTIRDGSGAQSVPAHVLASREPVVVGDLRAYPHSPRLEPALRCGLRSGFAFPILDEQGVIGIFEFYDVRDSSTHDLPLINTMASLGRRLGEHLQRVRAQESLRMSENNLAEAEAIAGLGNYLLHVPSGTLTWSAGTFDLFGCAPDFQPSLPSYLAFVHPEDRERIRTIITPPYPALSVEFRHRFVRTDGETRAAFCRFRVLEGTASEPVQVLGIIQDVTDRVEAEATIARLALQNRTILDSTAEGIVGAGPDGRVIFVNAAAIAMTGYSSEEFLAAEPLSKLLRLSNLSGEPLQANDCAIVQTLGDGRVRQGTAAFWTKSDALMRVEFATSPMTLHAGGNGSVLSFSDVTEKHALQRKLEQSQRVSSLGRVAATIAHEFNNVLMGIQPFAEVIARRPTADEKLKKAAAQIMHSVARGKGVTNAILRFTQPSPPAADKVIVQEWLETVVPELRGLISERITIDVDLPEEPVAWRGDAAQMHQVITNLVINARDAIGGEGTIVIAVNAHPELRPWPFGRVSPEMLVLSISDTGSGMPPHVVDKVFEPLFTTKRSGTGLGLAVVQQILTAHGGAIHVDSAIGAGTTFYLVLPRTSLGGDPETHAAHPQGADLRTVLIVEDELVVAAGLAALLEMDGVNVRVVHRGADVMDALEGELPELVIMDVTLPDRNGASVYQDVAARWPTLPVLFSTGNGDERALGQFLQRKHVGFLRKPYDYETLMDKVDELLAPTDDAVRSHHRR